jgi:hypothetical protein
MVDIAPALTGLKYLASIVILCALLLSGCVQKDKSIQFRAVRVVDYYDQRELLAPDAAGLDALIGREAAKNLPPGMVESYERPHRLQLRIEFSSTSDLLDVSQQGALLTVEGFFCTHPNDYALVAYSSVYFDGESLLPGESPRDQEAIGRERVYYFYANVAAKASPMSGPPEIGFDLRISPEDICFRVEGRRGLLGVVYESKVARVPRADIESAFRAAHNLDSIPAQ